MASITIGERLPSRPLCFEDGNIVIKLEGDEVSHTLLLHKNILDTAMPPLAASFGDRWGKGVTAKHPKTGEDVKVYSMELELMDSVYTLVAKVRNTAQHDHGVR